MSSTQLYDRSALIQSGMDFDLVEKIDAAYWQVRALIERDTLVSIAWSGGKDSTTCLAIAVLAYHDAVRVIGRALPIAIITADTLIDNPVVHFYWRRMVEDLEAYAEDHGLDIRVRVAKPTLISSWVVKVVSGCGLPTFANSKHRKCSIDLKREPANRVLKRLVPEIRSELSSEFDRAPSDFLRLTQMMDALNNNDPVVIVGTRFGESANRDRRMASRGDVAGRIRRNEDGLLTLPLIADFSLEDVWELLALAGQMPGAALPAFAPNFNATRDLYREATGECVIVAGEKPEKAGCGTRFGCSMCTAVSADRSMETMLQDPRYAFMRPLNSLRDFLVATQNDHSRRRWVGRGFHPVTGYVKVAPDGYSSAMCEELLLLMLTIDAEEQERALRLSKANERRLGGENVTWPDAYLRQCEENGEIDEAYLARMIEPQFQLVSPETLIMLDFAWGRYAVHRPFRALWLYREVYVRGARYPVPVVDAGKFSGIAYPAVRWAQAPRNPFRFNPLFDALDWAMMEQPGISLPAVTDKTVSMQVNENDTFAVDPEGAYWIINYERDSLLSCYHDDDTHSPMAAVHYYLRIGTVSVPKGRIQETGALAERNLRLRHAGLDPQFGREELQRVPSISQAEHTLLISQMTSTPDLASQVNATAATRPTQSRQLDLFDSAA